MKAIVLDGLLGIVAKAGEMPGGKVAGPGFQAFLRTRSIVIDLQSGDA
jgi:hypothetical protein